MCDGLIIYTGNNMARFTHDRVPMAERVPKGGAGTYDGAGTQNRRVPRAHVMPNLHVSKHVRAAQVPVSKKIACVAEVQCDAGDTGASDPPRKGDAT